MEETLKEMHGSRSDGAGTDEGGGAGSGAAPSFTESYTASGGEAAFAFAEAYTAPGGEAPSGFAETYTAPGTGVSSAPADPKPVSAFALYGFHADLRTFSPLPLAFLGDAVYSLIIRTTVLAKGNRQAEKLHNETTRLVRAQKQAAIGRSIYDLLTAEEKKVYRRGRNANPMHHAKGASLEEYLQATALETLCGYLYLQGKLDRVTDLLRTGLDLTKRREGDPLL